MKTYITLLLVAGMAFFSPLYGLLIAVGVSIMLDTITGLFKTIKLNGWRSITSRRLSQSISKILLYQITLILIFVMDQLLLNEFIIINFKISFMFTKIIAIFLLLIELVSVKENIEAALKIDFWKILKNVFQRAKEIKEDINDIAN